MIIQFGPDKNGPYSNWNDKRIFVSRPFFKLVFNNGFGLYILNSFKFRVIPKFYGRFHSSFVECGFDFLGATFEAMWNKSFKV